MKISIDEINKRDNPYQLFLDSIKNDETLRKYKNALHAFLKLVPSLLYKDNLGNIPKKNDIETLSELFIELARKKPELVVNIIAAFVKEKRKLVEAGKISPNTLPNYIKPIKTLLDSNRIPVHWKSINRLLPRRRSTSSDRAYTKQELQKMMEVAKDITDKVIITMFSSGGFRLESWDYFEWQDVIFFQNKDDSYKGAALRIYRNDPEEYWTFITPEACKILQLYKERWKSDIGEYPKPHHPLLKTVRFPTIHKLNSKGVKKRVEKIAKQIGLRPTLPPGKRRHEVQLDHGFRKYFNTMMRRAKVNYLDKEDMMGHKVGLERHYERYQEADFERSPEYQKAISFLTIYDEERLRFENQQKQQEIEEIEKKNLELQDLAKRIDELESGPKTRWDEYIKNMFAVQDDPAAKIWLTIFQFWFEMRATEEEKRLIWKKIQQAKKEGKLLDISKLRESKGLSLDNLYSEK